MTTTLPGPGLSPRRAKTIRSHLFLLALGTVVPVIAFAVFVSVLLVEQDQETVRRGAMERARAMMTAVDAELRGSIATVLALGASQALEADDLRTFHAEATRILATQPTWFGVSLVLPTGERVVDTSRPFGTPLPPVADMANLERAVRTLRPVVGDVVAVGTIIQDASVPVGVPILRNGALAYVLRAHVQPESFGKLIRDQHLPEGWTSGIVDGNGRFVARIPPRPAGSLAAENYRAAVRGGAEGWFRGQTLEGKDIYSPYVHSQLSNWTSGFAMPAEAVQAAAWRTSWIVGIGALASLVIALAIASWMGRRIAAPIRLLAATARSLGAGDSIAPVRAGGVEEIAQVAVALKEAADAVRERQEALRQSEERYRAQLAEIQSIYDSAHVGLCVFDRDLRYVRINQRLAEINGVSAAEHIGKTPEEVIPALAATAREIAERIFRTGEGVTDIEFSGTTASHPGLQRTWVEQWWPLKDSAGRVVGINVAVEEITARKQAAEAQRETDARYRLLFQNMLVGVAHCRMLFDERRRPINFSYLDVNDSFPKLTGLEDVVGKRVTEVIPGIRESNPELFEIYGRVASTGQPERFETCVEPLGIWLSITVYSPQKDHFVAVFDNITERKRAEIEIRRLNDELKQRVVALDAANKELDAFAYSVSHDLRAPLRGANAFSRILQEKYASEMGEDSRHCLQMIRDNTTQMGHLIDDLLAFSRLSQQPLLKQPVRQEELVETALESLEAERKGRQIDLTVGELGDAEADPRLLKQVWANLIGNALKYTRGKDKAEIRIGAQTDNGVTVYFVRDNGVGFDMRYAHKLFGVFQRLHSADDYEGTGVGLAVAQRIISRHGGRIWAQAAAGQGAAFYFTLQAALGHV